MVSQLCSYLFSVDVRCDIYRVSVFGFAFCISDTFLYLSFQNYVYLCLIYSHRADFITS